MDRAKYLIVGAGPTGIGAAVRLKDLGETSYLLIDRNPHVGGLAASFVDRAGFTWDIGGHVQFSHYKYFDDAMELALPAGQWLEHQRESWVWTKDRFVPYPFQNNIRFLPKESLWHCLSGVLALLKQHGPHGVPANFREWILATFGQGIAEEFLFPYNYKVWAFPPETMSYQWIGERVSVVDIERMLKNIIFETDDVSWGPNNKFKFPLQGGTGAIWESLARWIGLNRIRLNTSVSRILPDQRLAILENGESIAYEHLLSTIPLDVLASRVKGIFATLPKTAQRLKHSQSHIVGVGVEGQAPPDIGSKCWMYFPESNCPFYRVTVFSNYSPNNVPDIKRQYSLMCETSESEVKRVDASRVVPDTVQGLRNTRLIGPKDRVISTWHYRADYGYPTPSLERDSILNSVIPVLDDIGVFSRGRFGAWKYEVSNQDHSFMQGVEWVNYVVLGNTEETFTVKRSVGPHKPYPLTNTNTVSATAAQSKEPLQQPQRLRARAGA